MKILRIVLLGLAAIVLGTLGWRLVSAPPRGMAKPPAEIASAQPSPASPARPEPAAAPTPSPTPAPESPLPSAPAPVGAQRADASPSAPSAAPTVEVPAAPAGRTPSTTDPALAMTAQDAHAKILAILQGAPDLSRAFDALKAQFPAVADRTLSEATEAYRTSGTLPSADDLFAEAMRDLRLSSGVLAAKAGPDALGAIFDIKAKVLGDLEQADPRICADYLFGGTSPEFADFQAAHRSLIATSALATIDAMVDGRTRQTVWAEPTADDFHWIETALDKRGLSPDEIVALLDGRSPATPPTDERLCDNARTYLDVLRSMPADARNRVYGLTAELLARS